MAHAHFTSVAAAQARQAFGTLSLMAPPIEKISCWNGSFFELELVNLIGRSVRVGEILAFNHGDGYVRETHLYDATVVAIQLGSIQHGVETSVLLKHADSSECDYVDINNLTVLGVSD